MVLSMFFALARAQEPTSAPVVVPGEATVPVRPGLVGSKAPQERPRPPPVVLAPGVTLDGWDVVILGALDKKLMDDVVIASGPMLGKCWNAAKRKSPGILGRVALKIRVESTGAVSEVTVKDKQSTVYDSALTSCVVEVANAWRFPEPQGGGIVIAGYPIDFGVPATTPGGDGTNSSPPTGPTSTP